MATKDNETQPDAQPEAAAQPQVIVQMMNNPVGEPTEGLAETKPGGEYIELRPDGKGGTMRVRVNAHGQEL